MRWIYSAMTADDRARLERIFGLLGDDDREWLSKRLEPAWRQRERQLAARDAALCELAATLAAASGRELAATVRKRLARPTGSPAAERALAACGGRVPGADQIRAILAGARSPGGWKSPIATNQRPGESWKQMGTPATSERKAVGVVSVLKKAVSGDGVAALEREIAELRETIASQRAEAVRLGDEWLAAPSQAAAEAIEARRVECLRVAAAAELRLSGLETRLTEARAAAQRDALARHRAVMAGLYPRLRQALDNAAKVQQQVIAARDAAVAELGEGLASVHIPHLAYAGFLYEDLIAMWAADQERIWSAPWQPPAPPPRPAASHLAEPPPFPGSHQISRPGSGPALDADKLPATMPSPEAQHRRNAPQPAPPTAAVRKPRREPPPPAAGEHRVTALRPELHCGLALPMLPASRSRWVRRGMSTASGRSGSLSRVRSKLPE